METKDLWLWVLRQTLYILDVVVVICVGRSIVDSTWRQFVGVVKDFLSVVVFKNSHHESSVFVVSHTTSIVTFSSQILQGIEWSLVWILIDENSELSDTDSQVTLIELIGNVPSERSELSSFLNHCVIEAQSKHKLSEFSWLHTILKEVLHVVDGIDCVRRLKI